MANQQRIIVLGGGPGGYEAALSAARLGADVTVVSDGLGGSAVLTDCVPSKTLIAVAEVVTLASESAGLGVRIDAPVTVDLAAVNTRIKKLAEAQSADIGTRLAAEGVRVVDGRGRLDGASRVLVGDTAFEADAVLVATGAHPRVLPQAVPDGERILTWEQLYDLEELPERLVVVGSGVTGAEFASAYNALGSQVTLVSSRDRVLPGEDSDAAHVLEEVFARRGMTVLGRSRATSVTRTADGVVVGLQDGRTVEGTHCLLAVGSIPNTAGIGLEEAGVTLDRGGYIEVDKVSRTSNRGIYAAGDCTGVLMLASVAAMQGRIAIWHSLGEALSPLKLREVSSNVFTDPEIATVGWSQTAADEAGLAATTLTLSLHGNARAKMQGIDEGFVKLTCRTESRLVLGGVIVAPRASELIHVVATAVSLGLTVDQLAKAFTVYPSLSGSIAEAAHQLHQRA
ncbi:dihydrolipoamide dehydrogenase [Motilibacter peucedani]|uniref:NAD(P)H dehydrogenase (quinone) n=1 Tax=Motilibacter peucedani TaxID=598650 RepID=A0A420XLZ3_9ACTN|nr:NAD(P)H-quinone dehydrogenase [Motilibacter peucedani]RKS71512.1 dihydrolipoamide dehydrogenase [Motilibacter peucedani]